MQLSYPDKLTSVCLSTGFNNKMTGRLKRTAEQRHLRCKKENVEHRTCNDGRVIERELYIDAAKYKQLYVQSSTN